MNEIDFSDVKPLQIETLFFQAEIRFQIDMEFSDKKCSFATVWQGL